MIELTRLNGNKFKVNPDLIKYFEAAPDTTLTLVTGEKLLVVESCASVTQLATEYRAEVLREAWPDALAALGASSGYLAYAGASERDGKIANAMFHG